ncbi:MAG: DMT family transporter [Burkholderiales bacterium]|nr:MAG: DMT family transporter [Burkholderiales bacterium]
MRPQDAAALVALAGLWGGSYLLMRIAVGAFGPVALIETRVAVAAMLLLPMLIWQGARIGLRQLAHVAVIGLGNTAIPFLLIAYAIQTLSVGLASILNATSPLFGAIVAWAWLRDPLDRWRVAGLCVGFAGVVVLLGDRASLAGGADPSVVALSIAATLGAALMYGIGASYARRFLQGAGSLPVAAYSQSVAALALAPVGWAYWPAEPPGAVPWAAVVALGAGCTGLAYLLYFRLIANIGPVRAISVTFLIPAFGMFWGRVVLGEPVTLRMLTGAAVILCGTALATGLLAPGRRATARRLGARPR